MRPPSSVTHEVAPVVLRPPPGEDAPWFLSEPSLLADAHDSTRPRLVEAAIVLAQEENWNTSHHWTPDDTLAPDGNWHRLPMTTARAQTTLYLNGHRPVSFIDLLTSWFDVTRSARFGWAKTAPRQEVLAFLAYEKTGINWRASEDCHLFNEMPRPEIRAFAETFGGQAFNVCWFAGLKREEFAAITAAGGFDPVGGWDTVATLAALNGIPADPDALD